MPVRGLEVRWVNRALAGPLALLLMAWGCSGESAIVGQYAMTTQQGGSGGGVSQLGGGAGTSSGGLGGSPAPPGGAPSIDPTDAGAGGVAGAEGGSGGVRMPPTSCEGPLSFADPVMEEQVRAALNVPTGPIPPSSAAGLLELTLDGVVSIDGIECLTELTKIEITSSVDLSSLKALPALTGVIVTTLTQQHLDSLADFPIGADLKVTLPPSLDLTPLGTSTKLGLELVFVPDEAEPTRVSQPNLAPLDGIAIATLVLRQQGFAELAIEDLPALAPQAHGDIWLNSLTVEGIALPNLATVTQYPFLYELRLIGAGLTDITPLSALRHVHTLELRDNQITDLAPLAARGPFTAQIPLFDVNLSSNLISDASPLAQFSVLSSLDLSDNAIVDLSWITQELFQLTELRLSSNQIVDVSPITALTAVGVVSLRDNAIADLTAFSQTESFRPNFLELAGNPIDCTAQLEQIATLRDRGILVEASVCAAETAESAR